jgi:hypothetical protein
MVSEVTSLTTEYGQSSEPVAIGLGPGSSFCDRSIHALSMSREFE